jgi:hypothetical protein
VLPPEKETLKPPTCCWASLKIVCRCGLSAIHIPRVSTGAVSTHTPHAFSTITTTHLPHDNNDFFLNLNSLSSSYFKMRSSSGPAYRHPSQAHLPVSSHSKPRFMFLRTPSAMFSTFNIIRASIYCTFISSAQCAKLIAMISPCIPMEYHLLGHRGSLPERTQCLRSQ